MSRKLILLFVASSCILTGCAGMTTEQMKDNITVSLPVLWDSTTTPQVPVVFYFQGSGGTNHRAEKWADWFGLYGVAAVMIDNASVRGVKKLSGLNYASDFAPALEIAGKDPRLDLSHYAIMGFSRGGTQALKAGSYIKSKNPQPDFVFSLYPGARGECPNYHSDETEVFVFYGELDEWGTHQDNRAACKNMASGYNNASFHLLTGSHHGYDGDRSGRFGRRGFKKEPNRAALEETREIILEAIQRKWNLTK